jgi:hypothetical protein
MKRIFLGGLLLFAAIGSLKAQDCEALVLPYFNNNVQQMAQYPAEKFEWRCAYAYAAFYESDTIPSGISVVHNISEVRSIFTGDYLPASYVVDLNTLSIYAYNFRSLQTDPNSGYERVCFSTPSSSHPYLVLRSMQEEFDYAHQLMEERNK